jgi:CRISPR-associated protein (TIGR03984 family)
MTREIKQTTSAVTALTYHGDDDLRGWFEQQMRANRLRWLLAYADDGVIWGELRDTLLVTSDTAFAVRSPAGTLRTLTLQRAYAFGPDAELLLRRADNDWCASLRRDGAGGEADYYDERYLLWGTDVGATRAGFVELTEGARGIRHTPPALVIPRGNQRGGLLVRHYLTQDSASGLLRVSARRLVDLQGAKE